MSLLEVEDETRIFYNDWGSGKPVVLIHGWPLDRDMWAHQALFLADNGFRVIAYDRRGFGRSSQPWSGYDYDTLAGDLHSLVEKLDLRDATLVGFSMGGGEVARYIARHGSARIAKAVLISSVTPFLLHTEDNPSGVPHAVLEDILDGLRADRPHFFTGFTKQFFGQGLMERHVSPEMLKWNAEMAMRGSLRATLECAKSFATTDFRQGLGAFDIPTLLIHGTADRNVPIESSALETMKHIANAKLLEYENEPHGLHVTAKDRLNADLLAFLQE